MCCAYSQLTKLTNGKDFEDMNTMSGLFDKLIQCLVEYHPLARKQNENVKGISGCETLERKITTVTSDGEQLLTKRNNTLEGNVNEITGHSNFLFDLGKVALCGYIGEDVDRVYFSEYDFKLCGSEAKTILSRGLETGILIQETNYGGTIHGKKKAHNISFVLKIFKEKLAGMYLADVLRSSDINEMIKTRNFITEMSFKRIMDLKNVLLFACGSNICAARFIINHTIKVLTFDQESLKSFLKGYANFKKWQDWQTSIEFCFQMNYESQSEGELNTVLEPLLTDDRRIRLVEPSSLVIKHVCYFLKYFTHSRVNSLELIRLHGDTEFALWYWLSTFPKFNQKISQIVAGARKLKIEQGKPDSEEKENAITSKLKMVKEVAERNVPKHMTNIMLGLCSSQRTSAVGKSN